MTLYLLAKLFFVEWVALILCVSRWNFFGQIHHYLLYVADCKFTAFEFDADILSLAGGLSNHFVRNINAGMICDYLLRLCISDMWLIKI